MHVQNYAGRGINRGSCRKCSLGWHAICLRYSYNIGHYFNCYRASRGSLSSSWASCWNGGVRHLEFVLHLHGTAHEE